MVNFLNSSVRQVRNNINSNNAAFKEVINHYVSTATMLIEGNKEICGTCEGCTEDCSSMKKDLKNITNIIINGTYSKESELQIASIPAVGGNTKKRLKQINTLLK